MLNNQNAILHSLRDHAENKKFVLFVGLSHCFLEIFRDNSEMYCQMLDSLSSFNAISNENEAYNKLINIFNLIKHPYIEVLIGEIFAKLVCEKKITEVDALINLIVDEKYKLIYLAVKLICMKDFRTALQNLDAAISLDANNVFALARRGEVHRGQGNYAAALVDLNKAIRLDANNVFALGKRGGVYRLQGKYMEALDDLNKVIRLDANNVYALVARGEVYRMQGKYTEALDDLNNAISLDANNVYALVARGEVYRMQGKYTEALDDLNNAISLDANNVFALVSRGSVYGMQGRYTEALDDLNAVISLDANNVFALARRGELHRMQIKYTEALDDLNKAIRLDANNVFALASRGDIYRMQRKYAEALVDLNKAIRLDGNNVRALGRRGHIYGLQGKYTEALDDFRNLLKIMPLNSSLASVVASKIQEIEKQKSAVLKRGAAELGESSTEQSAEKRQRFNYKQLTESDLKELVVQARSNSIARSNCSRLAIKMLKGFVYAETQRAAGTPSGNHAVFFSTEEHGMTSKSAMNINCGFNKDLADLGIRINERVIISLDEDQNDVYVYEEVQKSQALKACKDIVLSDQIKFSVNADQIAFGIVALDRPVVKIETGSSEVQPRQGHLITWYYSPVEKKLYFIDPQTQDKQNTGVFEDFKEYMTASDFTENVFWLRLDDKYFEKRDMPEVKLEPMSEFFNY